MYTLEVMVSCRLPRPRPITTISPSSIPGLQFGQTYYISVARDEDNLEGDSARGDYIGNLRGAVRPMLDWSTDYVPPRG